MTNEETIVHLATREQWAEAQASGFISAASLDTEGFVHCSTEAQVPGTIERHFSDADELVLVHLHAAAVVDLRWEAPPDRPDGALPTCLRADTDSEREPSRDLASLTQLVTWREGWLQPNRLRRRRVTGLNER